MKIINNYTYTQIRIDNKLRQFVRLACAMKQIHTRKEFCKRSLKHFMESDQKILIAPVRRGVLFRIELPLETKAAIEQIATEKGANVSRVLHTAIYEYVDSFLKSLPEFSKSLIYKAYE